MTDTHELDRPEAVDQDWPLAELPPDDFDAITGYSVEITYTVVNGERIFSYHESPLLPFTPVFFASQREVLGIDPSRNKVKENISAELLGAALDLRVRQDCIIVMRTDDNIELFWERGNKAIMTKNVRRSLYFGLRYIHKGIAYEDANFPPGEKCRQIVFGAKHNSGGPIDDPHPFSLNLICEDGLQPREVYIDPDIKNPSS